MKHIQLFLFALLMNGALLGQTKTGYLTQDGTWCWFSDPRAIMIDNTIISGWVKANGTIEAVKFDTDTKQLQTSELYHRLEVDDHDNPAFTVTERFEKMCRSKWRNFMKSFNFIFCAKLNLLP